MKTVLKRIWNYMEGVNGLVLSLYMIIIFFAGGVAAGKGSPLYWLSGALTGLAISVAVCPTVLKALAKITIPVSKCDFGKNTSTAAAAKACFFLVPLCVFLLFWFCCYPGAFSGDSYVQLEQVQNNRYSDWHPVIQTLFAFKLPLMLTGGWVGSIVLFQILCLSAVIAYALNVILDYTSWKIALISMAFLMVNPLTGAMAMSPWKDVSFGMGALLTLTYGLRIVATKGCWLKKPLHMVLFVCAIVLTTLFRHNAILFTAPLMLAILLHVTPKKGIVLCLSIVLLYGAVKFPLYSALDVESPDKRQIEMLGLPMTVIGGAVVYSSESLDSETLEFAYKVAPREVWEEKYTLGTYNFVKWDERTDNSVIEEYGAVKVLSMMVRCFKNAKSSSLKALIYLTDAIYNVNLRARPHSLPFYYLDGTNGDTLPAKLLVALCKYSADNCYLFNLAAVHLAMVLSILAKYRLTRMKDWKKLFYVLSPFAYNYGTTLLLTGSDDATRFFTYTTMLLPTILVFIYRNNSEGNVNENV